MSERRRARAHAVKTPDSGAPPPELFDAGAAVWHNPSMYAVFMAGHGWSMYASERLGRPTHPVNSRNHAAAQWALANGITRDGSVDWHRLTAMGLTDGSAGTGHRR